MYVCTMRRDVPSSVRINMSSLENEEMKMKIWRIDWPLIWAVVYLSTAYFKRFIASSCGLTQRFKKRFVTVAGPLVPSARRRYWFSRVTGTRPSSFLRLYQSHLRQGRWRAALPVDGGDRCPGTVLSSVAARVNRKIDSVPCVECLNFLTRPCLYGRIIEEERNCT